MTRMKFMRATTVVTAANLGVTFLFAWWKDATWIMGLAVLLSAYHLAMNTIIAVVDYREESDE